MEGDDVSTAVEKARDLALQIIDNPNDTNLVTALAEKLAFLANVAGSDARYTDILDAGGVDLLASYIAALKCAKPSLAHEQAAKDASYMALQLAQKAGAATLIENGTFEILLELFKENPAYEECGNNLTRVPVRVFYITAFFQFYVTANILHNSALYTTSLTLFKKFSSIHI